MTGKVLLPRAHHLRIDIPSQGLYALHVTTVVVLQRQVRQAFLLASLSSALPPLPGSVVNLLMERRPMYFGSLHDLRTGTFRGRSPPPALLTFSRSHLAGLQSRKKPHPGGARKEPLFSSRIGSMRWRLG